MKPFILKQHEKDNALVRELRENEVGEVNGGVTKLPTITVTPEHDHTQGADGTDEG